MQKSKTEKELEKALNMLISNRKVEDFDEATLEQIRENYELAHGKALFANVYKDNDYKMKNEENEAGLCQWENDIIAETAREGAYCRIENMLHILATTNLTKLCELKKQQGEHFYNFIYDLYTIPEIEELYDGEQEHLTRLAKMFEIKAEIAKRLFKINRAYSESNRFIYNTILQGLCDKMSEYDILDADPEMVYNIEDTLIEMLDKLSTELQFAGVTEEVLLDKFISSCNLLTWLIDVDNIAETIIN